MKLSILFLGEACIDKGAVISPGVGLVRITWFPGSMGLEFAQSLDAAIADLKARDCERLLVDLRRNIGGGLASRG